MVAVRSWRRRAGGGGYAGEGDLFGHRARAPRLHQMAQQQEAAKTTTTGRARAAGFESALLQIWRLGDGLSRIEFGEQGFAPAREVGSLQNDAPASG
jgi:hypothetical protein